MKKYISILVVALVALFATSCQLSGGTDPNPNRKYNLLWNRVNDAINQHYDHAVAVAYLNDVLLDRTYYIGDAYYPSDLRVEDDIYTLSYGSTYYARSYRIKTNGKRLDEGGEWTIYYRTSTYTEYVPLGKAVGIVGETSRFNLSIDNIEYARNHYAYCYVAESEFEYEYDNALDRLCIQFNTFKGTSSDTSSQSDYMIEFEVVEPLVIRASIEQGKIDILYKDLVDNTSRELTVEIVNRIVTFVASNGSNR